MTITKCLNQCLHISVFISDIGVLANRNWHS